MMDQPVASNVGNAKLGLVVTTLSIDKICCGLAAQALGPKTSPSSAMMSVATNRRTSWLRKNGDEGSSEAAHPTTTAVVDRERATVSHPPGLEASPTGRAPGT